MMNVKKIAARFCVLVAFAIVATFPALAGTPQLGVSEAHELAMRGAIVLVDVRTPEEWEKTGVATSAQAVSMHRPGFFKKIKSLVHGDKTQAIAVICATGQRSKRVQAMMRKRGYTNIIDVSEGMLGSAAGPGWINSGLPVQDPS